MADMKRTANDIIRAMKDAGKKTPSAYDTTAEVIRVENGTAWVHIPGGVDETPAALTIDASVGDTVQVRVSGGNAWIVGNQTAPPTSDKTAKEALKTATSAKSEIGSTMTGDVLFYLATDLASGVTVNTPGWTESPQAITEAKPYLWTYHTYTFANGNTVESVPVLTGVYGPKGEPGDPGTPGGKGDKGDTGVSVSTITTQYYLSTSRSSATGGSWGTSLPAYVSGRYYWTRERATYSDGSTKYSPSSSGVYSPGLTQACQLSYDTAQHFWTQTTGTTSVPTGAYVTEQTESAYKSNPTGGATLIRSDKVDIRVGTKTYSRFDGNGTTIYDGNGTAASNILGKFTAGEAQVGSGATGSGNTKIVANELSMNNGSTKQASLRYDTTPVTVPILGQLDSHRVVLAKAEEEKDVPNQATISSRLMASWDKNTEPIAFVTAEHKENTAGTTKTASSSLYSFYNNQMAIVQAATSKSEGAYVTLWANSIEIIGDNFSVNSGGRVSANSFTAGGLPSGLLAEEVSIVDNLSVTTTSPTAAGTKSVAKTGYTPIGIVGFRCVNASSSGTNGAYGVISRAYLSGTNNATANYRVRNVGTGSMKVRIYFTVLYALS